jgi:fructoselysine-6-P-deglycase FrlB-like protein
MERIEYWTVLRAQAESLRTSVAAVEESLAGARLPKWPVEQSLSVVGMGASSAAAHYFVDESRARGRAALNLTAAEYRREQVPTAACVAISESGRSPETIDALGAFPGPRLAITNVPASPITRVAETSVIMGDVADAGVYVSGYTSTLAALAALGERIGLTGMAGGIAGLPDVVAVELPRLESLVRALLAERLLDEVPMQVDCVGAGGSLASAAETALMMREGARLHSASFQTDQYLHGPAEATCSGGLTVIFGGGRGAELADRLGTVGADVLFVGSGESADIRLPETSALTGRILEAIVGQVLVGRFAELRHLTPGSFQYHFEGTKLPVTGDSHA